MELIWTTDAVTDDSSAAECYRAGRPEGRGGRPYVAINMVSTLDGATATESEGTSGGLGNDGDKELFRAMREMADVILVAAGTVRDENYGVARLSDEAVDRRRHAGRAPLPRMAIVTRSLSLDPEARIFAEHLDAEAEQPIVFATERSPADRLAALAAVAETAIVGVEDVDLAAVLRHLRAAGNETVLCEGGPTLNGQMLAFDLVDELTLSVAPVMASGDAKRVAVGPAAEPPVGMKLQSIARHDEHLFLRYVRAGD